MTNYLYNLLKHITNITTLLFKKLDAEISYKTIKNELLTFNYSLFKAEFSFDLFKYIIIPFLLIVIISFVILLIVNRYGFEKKIIIKNEVDIKINDFLTEIIFSNYDSKHIKEQIKLFKEEVPFKKKWCKGIILNKIITIKRNINGVNPHQMLLIYKYFGFHDYSKKLIRSRSWENKLLGIYHYQILEYKIKTGYIRPNIYVKNKFLKSNALIAVISLSDQKFDFLSNYEKQISYADELKILDIIHQKKSALPKKINEWLYNKNSSVVILAIKLMIRYRETLTIDQISHLLNNTNSKVRRETYLVIRNLYIIEANELLINHYPKETDKRNKISALKTMGAIGDNDTKDFALSILLAEADLEIKFEIVNCINKIDATFFNTYKTEDTSENEIIKRIVLHVNNPYLN
ncbi:HEAT repeat domain-containing protein [Flavobacterium sp. ZE23DGlu08]|uniref:HEAT repeat domain-containing protein n=1 Tax=Flavobacterium sp. ZE23DGlu08 TaxID=3059026 RepID=UPI00265DCD06|nr:hypothetical protein [Flavobacterium sp. ZE23DGlu08]WKL43380.1 hypothetical protein Q1W72_13605 [Flavobacterium sp. ZE23DGlu08]